MTALFAETKTKMTPRSPRKWCARVRRLQPNSACRNRRISENGHQAGQAAPPVRLKAVSVRKRFGGVEALRGVDFEVARGEVMALVGDNGAGKSTLMKILAGADKADGGQFFIDGRQVELETPHQAADQGIQIVHQDLALCENLDVSANLSLGGEPVRSGWKFLPRFLRPLDDLEMEAKATAAISRLEVKTLRSVRARVGGLSGGQRQAIAIARAVGTESSVILLDEPTAALGVAQTKQALDLIGRLRASGHAIVYISHNLNDVFEISDRICVLRQGSNVATWETARSTPDEIVIAMRSGRRQTHQGTQTAA